MQTICCAGLRMQLVYELIIALCIILFAYIWQECLLGNIACKHIKAKIQLN